MTPDASVLSSAIAFTSPHTLSRPKARVVLIASSDTSLRERLRHSLTGLRWQVLEASSGAEAWMASQSIRQLEAILIDSWLPDLDVSEFLVEFHRLYPQVDLMMTDGVAGQDSPRSSYHQELLYALRRSQDGNTASWNAAADLDKLDRPGLGEPRFDEVRRDSTDRTQLTQLPQLVVPVQHGSASQDSYSSLDTARVEESGPDGAVLVEGQPFGTAASRDSAPIARREIPAIERIPELIGSSAVMLEVSRRVRLVAGRRTPVLIEGPTGSGKELVAEALHRLSSRSRKPFVAINCAAIPEALLEAELFGHTRGAFTGAVQGRTGRIEAADGGTLFLDEIGEMPLGLQSKLLRFFESGELQRIGDNETVKVDVRIVAATHQRLAEDAQKGVFRADLYYRLAVFLIRTPALAEHMGDLPQLIAHFLERMGRSAPVKRIDSSAMARLSGHTWPGNVRELEHVLERAAILSGDEPAITAAEIDFGLPLGC